MEHWTEEYALKNTVCLLELILWWFIMGIIWSYGSWGAELVNIFEPSIWILTEASTQIHSGL